jgi:hypothetical protein
MLAVLASAILFAVARFEDSCTPLSPFVVLPYLCGILGIYGARWRGRRARTGLLLGLFLGPIGLIFACSNPIPDRWSEERNDAARETPRSNRAARP